MLKEKTNKIASCSEISFLNILKTKLEILYGAVDFVDIKGGDNKFNFSLSVGERKKGSGFSYVR